MESANINAFIQLIRADVEGSRTVVFYSCSIYHTFILPYKLEGGFFALSIALPGLIYGQFRVAANVNYVIIAYFVLCNAAGLKLVHIDINGKVDGIESLLYGSFAYFCYSYNLIIYCKLKVLVCVCAIYD